MGPRGAAVLSGGPADGEVNGALGPPYGPLRPRGDDIELRERGGTDDWIGGSVEFKATGGTGLEKPPGAKAEMLEGLGMARGPETPEHKKSDGQLHA